jgi:hypothetical protein
MNAAVVEDATTVADVAAATVTAIAAVVAATEAVEGAGKPVDNIRVRI